MSAPLKTGTEKDPRRDFPTLCRAAFDTLHAEADLSPRNPRVNSCVTAFVGAVLDLSSMPGAAAAVLDPRVRALRPGLLEKLARAECEMERHVAEALAEGERGTPDGLDGFGNRTCYNDYRPLIAREARAMQEAKLPAGPGSHIVFVGSGPLPMTAIGLHLETGARITCLDSDPEAVRLSGKIIGNMGLSRHIGVRHAAGESFDYRGSDIVLIAALVRDKNGVVSRVRRTAPSASLALRGGEGVKALLYHTIDPAWVAAGGYACLGKSRDDPRTLTTTLFFSPGKAPSFPVQDGKERRRDIRP